MTLPQENTPVGERLRLPWLPTLRGDLDGLLVAAAPGLVAFALVVFLAFEGGGFDPVVRSEAGVAVWWGLLLAGSVGAAGLGHAPRSARIALGLIAALAAWTLLSGVWSESAGRSVIEGARVVTYGGALLAGMVLLRRGGGRAMLVGVASAIALVGLVALASRVVPQIFPEPGEISFLSEADERLNYPLNYWNGLATFLAMGLPLIAHFATRGRSLLTTLGATATLPALAFAIYLTLSRGGIVAAGLGLLALVAFYPERRKLVPVLAIAAVGTVALVVLASPRDAFLDGVRTGEGAYQANVMGLFVLAVCALAAAARALLLRINPFARLRGPSLHRATALKLGLPLAAVLIAGFFALGGAGWADDRWEEFKAPGNAAGTERLSSAGGTGRYQWWSAAVNAGGSEPVVGIGAGTWEFWWAREGTLPGFVRDSHSLYLESFAELGIIGLLLVVGFVGLVLVIALRRAGSSGERRPQFAAALGALIAFAAAAGVDWAWEQAVLPIAFMLVASTVLCGSTPTADGAAGDRGGRLSSVRMRAAVVVTATVAFVVLAVPLLGELSFRESQSDFRAGDFGGAGDAVQRAIDLEPYAASPRLQKALVLQGAGDLDGAEAAAREAIDREETNWQNWFILAQIEDQAGDQTGAEEALTRARELNPRSPLFN